MLITDIQGSSSFLKQIFKLKPAPQKNRALDVGAGIGRVSKNLLMHEFYIVDLLEQDSKFCEKAKENLTSSGRLGSIYNVGLQDFRDCGVKYDVIWIQWVLIYLNDSDLVDFLRRISQMLNKKGLIIVKENFTKGRDDIFDEQDSSVTRALSKFKVIIKNSDLRIIKETKQTNFPKDLFPVHILALKQKK